MTLEVRCCCQPEKLVGWLDLPKELVEVGKFRVAIASPSSVSPREHFEVESIILEVALIEQPPSGERYLAVKAEDIPVETLQRIPGFHAAYTSA